MTYDGGTRLKDARNNQIFPYTKAEYVEGLDELISGAVTAPDDTAENSVPVTTEDGSVEWVELQAGNISVKVSNEVFSGGSLDDVLQQISSAIKNLEDMYNNLPSNPGTPGAPGVTTSGFIPVLMSELPEVGEVGLVYRVPSENTSTRNEYDEYYWTGSAFEKIGNRDPGGDEWGSEDGDSGYEWIS